MGVASFLAEKPIKCLQKMVEKQVVEPSSQVFNPESGKKGGWKC